MLKRGKMTEADFYDIALDLAEIRSRISAINKKSTQKVLLTSPLGKFLWGDILPKWVMKMQSLLENKMYAEIPNNGNDLPFIFYENKATLEKQIQQKPFAKELLDKSE